MKTLFEIANQESGIVISAEGKCIIGNFADAESRCPRTAAIAAEGHNTISAAVNRCFGCLDAVSMIHSSGEWHSTLAGYEKMLDNGCRWWRLTDGTLILAPDGWN